MGDFDDMYRQSARNGRGTNICTTTAFPRLDKFPQVTEVCQVFWRGNSF